MSITILKPGISCSIQDLGRWGYQQFGVPIGGVMDSVSAKTANRICGNADEKAVLECTLHGTEIRFDVELALALSGGGARATMNGAPMTYNRLIRVTAGSVLKLHPDPMGCRTYMAIAGGFNINKELGSASTYTAAALGGLNGRDLIAGDCITLKDALLVKTIAKDLVIREHGFGMSNWKAQHFSIPHLQETISIGFVPGPEWDWFSTKTQEAFIQHDFNIGMQSNRMGYRLEGMQLHTIEKKELVSTAVTCGIVQITNEGHPIILMADAQTIGGYPRIARIISTDIALLAQCRPGMRVRFTKMT